MMHWSCCYGTDKNDPRCRHSRHTFVPDESPDEDQRRGATTEDDVARIFAKSDVPRHVINLDAPPAERWKHIVAQYTEHMPAIRNFIQEILGSQFAESAVGSLLGLLSRVGHVYFGEELRGIAAASGLSLGCVTLLQIAYEVFAACTSVVAHANGNAEEQSTWPLHIRTMDWSMDVLENVTIEVDYVTGDRTLLYKATTWAGYVGILTGMKPGAFSVSINYRRTEAGDRSMVKEVARNLIRGLVSRHWPVSFLVRVVLEQAADYHTACGNLEHSALMAPTYITVCGTQPGEGVAIARDRDSGVKFFAETVSPGSRGSHLARRCSDPAGQEAKQPNSQRGAPHTIGATYVAQANMDISRDHHIDGLMAEWKETSSAEARESATGELWQDICESRFRRAYVCAAIEETVAQTGNLRMSDLWLMASQPPMLAHDTVYTTAMVPATGEYVTLAKRDRKSVV